MNNVTITLAQYNATDSVNNYVKAVIDGIEM